MRKAGKDSKITVMLLRDPRSSMNKQATPASTPSAAWKAQRHTPGCEWEFKRGVGWSISFLYGKSESESHSVLSDFL